jgi:hypothetical protein
MKEVTYDRRSYCRRGPTELSFFMFVVGLDHFGVYSDYHVRPSVLFMRGSAVVHFSRSDISDLLQSGLYERSNIRPSVLW